jgi:threonylcarbamoyladenosine tRNA methylthiotransferase MtaB
MAERICILTIGCRTNVADSSNLGRILADAGYQLVRNPATADWVIVNSCTVTHGADRDAGKLLRRARREAPEAKLIICGCLPQAYPEQAVLANAQIVVAGNKPETLLAIIGEHGAAHSTAAVKTGKHLSNNELFPFEESRSLSRVNIKIQEGCDCRCTYCIVPDARGAPRSRPLEMVLAEVERAFSGGFQEVVLTGTHLARYRENEKGAGGLPELMKHLEELHPNGRIRLSSLEPDIRLLPVLECMANSRVWCRHLHVSLQHGCDKILQDMGRPYQAAEVLAFARQAAQIPGLALGMDIIAGFPTETDEHFTRGYEMIQEIPFTALHVFAFSVRPGTPASKLRPLPVPIVRERSKLLRQLAHQREQEFYQANCGKSADILVERRRDKLGRLIGLTDNYLRVYFKGEDSLMGKRIAGWLSSSPEGELLARVEREQ